MFCLQYSVCLVTHVFSTWGLIPVSTLVLRDLSRYEIRRLESPVNGLYSKYVNSAVHHLIYERGPKRERDVQRKPNIHHRVHHRPK